MAALASPNRYSSGLFVTPPAPSYPGVDFFGSQGSQPGGIYPSGGGPVAAINSALPPIAQSHHVIAIALVVAVGFGVYWWASRE